jgi:hypothetical protein
MASVFVPSVPPFHAMDRQAYELLLRAKISAFVHLDSTEQDSLSMGRLCRAAANILVEIVAVHSNAAAARELIDVLAQNTDLSPDETAASAARLNETIDHLEKVKTAALETEAVIIDEAIIKTEMLCHEAVLAVNNNSSTYTDLAHHIKVLDLLHEQLRSLECGPREPSVIEIIGGLRGGVCAPRAVHADDVVITGVPNWSLPGSVLQFQLKLRSQDEPHAASVLLTKLAIHSRAECCLIEEGHSSTFLEVLVGAAHVEDQAVSLRINIPQGTRLRSMIEVRNVTVAGISVENPQFIVRVGANDTVVPIGFVTRAVKLNDASQVENLLLRGLSTEETDQEGMTALLHAANLGFIAVVRALVVSGAHLESCNRVSCDVFYSV